MFSHIILFFINVWIPSVTIIKVNLLFIFSAVVYFLPLLGHTKMTFFWLL